ncbi:hypothetical protein GCM10009835_12700 [Planosporangium flavigriseum]|uniref:Transposase n=1 Tax=Planosporangium flavigriseum TaxID=373681 RepID=A0A8J3PNI9_9ACTN|nr:hypothetical protein Pfl04_33620 [Planosporangium flavigriseum]
MSRSDVYPQELRERAVRMVGDVRPDYESDWAAITAVAQKLNIGTAEKLRKWVRQAQVDAGQRPGVTSEESAELKRLRRENAEPRRTNEILKAASAFFAAELDRPQTHSLDSSTLIRRSSAAWSRSAACWPSTGSVSRRAPTTRPQTGRRQHGRPATPG